MRSWRTSKKVDSAEPGVARLERRASPTLSPSAYRPRNGKVQRSTPQGALSGTCDRSAARTRLRLGQKVPVLSSGGHGMDHQLLATFKDQHNGLKQAGPGVEAKPQLTMRPVIFLKRFDPLAPVGCLGRILGQYAVLECAGVDLHAAKSVRARRIASERDRCSRSATSSSAATSSAVRRTATTCIGSAPRPGRPRPRRFKSSTS